MTWHETIEYIRGKAAYQELIRLAYFDADLTKNVERFGCSEEFVETMLWIKNLSPEAKIVADIGAGNGIASINFALKNYQVIAIEPDQSNTVGTGAIEWLVEHYRLDHLVSTLSSTAENLSLPNESVDIVYVRQAMHHAHSLDDFIANCARILKKGGLLITVRDHVIWNEQDKQWFLKSHPLHHLYGGENAYSPLEYRHALTASGLQIMYELKHYDSVINYFPNTIEEITHFKENRKALLRKVLQKKIGVISKIPLVLALYLYKNRKQLILDENLIPGRMYSYICKKI